MVFRLPGIHFPLMHQKFQKALQMAHFGVENKGNKTVKIAFFQM